MDLDNDGVHRVVLAGDKRDPCGFNVPSLGEALVLATVYQTDFNLKPWENGKNKQFLHMINYIYNLLDHQTC